MKYPYRFKTEEEFLKEFGRNWRSLVAFSWVGSMDFLFGKDYPYEVENTPYVNRLPSVYTNESNASFSISWDMIIKKEEPKPNYLPKRKRNEISL